MDTDPLSLDEETMRRLGYQTVDMLVDWLASSGTMPVITGATRTDMDERLPGTLPEAGIDFEAIMGRLRDDVLPYMSITGHPGYFAFIPGCGTWPAALGDFIASACNIFNGSWMESAGPSRLELIVLDWFKRWIGYPAEAAGTLLSGGSAANMTALACARETLLGSMSDRVVVYLSDQAHSSLARSARILGFRPDQVRVLPTDALFRLQPEVVLRAMDADLEAGRSPLFVAASAGSTNSGAIDPLEPLGVICRERGVWFHVDAAYGGFAALTPRGKGWLQGIELADSVTLDPHKWLYQPYECGCLLVRAGHQLRDAFQMIPDYLIDAAVTGDEINFEDLGLQLTRMCRALKVWMSLSYFGEDAFRAAIDRTIDLARFAQTCIDAADTLELMHPASLGVVCFRRRIDVVDEEQVAYLNGLLLQELTASGRALLSSTRLRGRYAVRLCVLNHTTTAHDVQSVLEWFRRTAIPSHSPAEGVPVRERHAAVGGSWLDRRRVEPDLLRSLPLLSPLSDGDLTLIARESRVEDVAAGVTIVRQWEATSEFYLILAGTAEVRSGERCLNRLGPGDFFGELAALDWGSGFGYPRLASVVAVSPMSLLLLPNATFRTLMRDVPAFSQPVLRAVRERLPRI